MGQVDGTTWFGRTSRAEVAWASAVGRCAADPRSGVGGSAVRVAKGGDRGIDGSDIKSKDDGDAAERPTHSAFLGLDDVLEAQAVVKRTRTKGAVTPSPPVHAPHVVRKKRKATTLATVGILAERDAAVRKRSAMMATARVPAWLQAQDVEDKDAAVLGLAGVARGGTLKIRVMCWERYIGWLGWARGRSWPIKPADIVDYLNHIRQEGCAPSFPQVFKTTVNWMEFRGGFAIEDRLGSSALVIQNMDAVSGEVVDMDTEVRKAPCFLVSMLASLEVMVMDTKSLQA